MAAQPERPRISWSPRPGITSLECPSSENGCADPDPDICEATCEDGGMETCTALAIWHESHRGKGGVRARALELLRLVCGKGYGPGCVQLAANPRATAQDRALIVAALDSPCALGDACACWLYGEALSLDPQQEERGIEVLGEGCGRGALDACDSLELATQICERDTWRKGFCARIRAEKQLRPPHPEFPTQAPRAPLPSAFQGCFRVVAAADPLDGTHCVRRANEADQGWQWEDGDICPMDGSFESGALYCFAEDLYFMKPAKGVWDVLAATWFALPQSTVLHVRGEPSTGWAGLEQVRFSGREIVAVGRGIAAQLERLTGPEEKAARSETAALPGMEVACHKAYRCSRATPGKKLWAPPVGLRACLAREQEARSLIEQKLGAAAAKKACP